MIGTDIHAKRAISRRYSRDPGLRGVWHFLQWHNVCDVCIPGLADSFVELLKTVHEKSGLEHSGEKACSGDWTVS